MKIPKLPSYFLPLFVAAGAQSLSAITIDKANNATAIDTGGSWVGGTAPGSMDLARWNSTYTAVTAATLPQLTANIAWDGIIIGNMGGAVNSNLMGGFRHNTTSLFTLTLGAGGIDGTSATQAMRMESSVLIGANQTWNIINANTANSPTGFNNGEDLAFQGTNLVAAPAGQAPVGTFDLNGKLELFFTLWAGLGLILFAFTVLVMLCRVILRADRRPSKARTLNH